MMRVASESLTQERLFIMKHKGIQNRLDAIRRILDASSGPFTEVQKFTGVDRAIFGYKNSVKPRHSTGQELSTYRAGQGFMSW